MKKTKCGQIKLSKDKKSNFFNVTSSYNHLLEKISNELKLKEPLKASNQLKQNSLHKGSNNNSINYSKNSKKFSFSRSKASAGTVSFELPETNNERLSTEFNAASIKKSRDLSPGFHDTIKKLKVIQRNLFQNQFETKNHVNTFNNLIKNHQSNFITKNNTGNSNYNTKTKLTRALLSSNEGLLSSNEGCDIGNNVIGKSIGIHMNSIINNHGNSHHNKNADDVSYESEVCQTDPFQTKEKKHHNYTNNNNFINFKPKIKSKTKQKQSNSQDICEEKSKISRIQSEKYKKTNKNTSDNIKDPKLLTSAFNDLNININTNINTNISINTNPSTLQSTISKNSPLREPEIISINSLFNSQEVKIDLNILNEDYPQYDLAKASSKPINNIKAYGANTYQGIMRNYNEDRVSIILNIAQPPNFIGNWPKCSLFGIYDGHGGNACADFLRDKLHSFIITDKNFPSNPQEALKKGFEKAEEYFISNYSISKCRNKLIEKSGSCAILALIIENICYIANVGDSRALISLNRGKDARVLTTDHKPNEDYETKRIVSNGGKIYQTQTPTRFFAINNFVNTNQILLGPYRVFPGRLSVSRTIGDAEAKLPQFGGIPQVIIAEPEITYFCIDEEIDFLMMGCDGIFDQLSNEEISECVWTTFNCDDVQNVHSQCALGVDMIMKASLARKTLDNITVILIAFKNFEKEFNYCYAQKQYNYSLLTHHSNNNISNDSYQNSVIVTEPTYNVAHEKLVKNDFKHKTNSQEKTLSPPNSSKNMIFKNNLKLQKQKSSNLQPRIPLSPKMKKLLKETAKNKI